MIFYDGALKLLLIGVIFIFYDEYKKWDLKIRIFGLNHVYNIHFLYLFVRENWNMIKFYKQIFRKNFNKFFNIWNIVILARQYLHNCNSQRVSLSIQQIYVHLNEWDTKIWSKISAIVNNILNTCQYWIASNWWEIAVYTIYYGWYWYMDGCTLII